MGFIMYVKTWESFKKSFRNLNKAGQSFAEKSRETDRGLDRHVERLSRFIWPARETWLLVVVGFLILLDYTSTYIALQNANMYEDGPLAAWALRMGGFPLLLLVDIAAAGVLSSVAIVARFLYRRAGCKGYGRAAFVIILAPYIVRTVYVVINNIILGFR
jgi:hypothetical protein